AQARQGREGLCDVEALLCNATSLQRNGPRDAATTRCSELRNVTTLRHSELRDVPTL
ncbi:hypothetical protein HAX54_047299, partial [Datura stramonium]|nr:hypothetical protein [Datura stramonium]